MGREIECRVVGGKRVYLFDNHASALVPWAEMRRELDRPPDLLTFDFHTDTHLAFVGYLCKEYGYDGSNLEELSRVRCKKIDYNKAETVFEAVKDLRNDEQIDAAIKSHIFSRAIVISYSAHRLAEYSLEKQIWEIPSDIGFRYSHDVTESEIKAHADIAIETNYLHEKFLFVNSDFIARDEKIFGTVPFVLDIDLDYFRTHRGVLPDDDKMFRDLIRISLGITIAREPRFVESERIDEDLDSTRLESSIVKLITLAMAE